MFRESALHISPFFSGIPEQLREVAKNSKPALEVSNNGNSWTLKTTVSDRVKNTTFNVGEEFESKSLTGETMKVSKLTEKTRLRGSAIGKAQTGLLSYRSKSPQAENCSKFKALGALVLKLASPIANIATKDEPRHDKTNKVTVRPAKT